MNFGEESESKECKTTQKGSILAKNTIFEN